MPDCVDFGIINTFESGKIILNWIVAIPILISIFWKNTGVFPYQMIL